MASGTWDMWEMIWHLVNPPFLYPVYQGSFLLNNGSAFSSISLLSPICAEGFFGIDIPGHILLLLGFNFSNFIPECSENGSVFLSYPLALFSPFVWFLVFEFGYELCSSTKVFWYFCLISYSLPWTTLENGKGDLWLFCSFLVQDFSKQTWGQSLRTCCSHYETTCCDSILSLSNLFTIH